MENTNYRPGDYKAVCESCGFIYMASELLERWDGLRVCKKDWETRHPQEFVRTRPEKIVPEWTSPDTDTLYPDLTTITAPATVALAASQTDTLYRAETTGAGAVSIQLPDANDGVFANRPVTYVLQLETGTVPVTITTLTAGRFVGNTTINPGQIARVTSDPANNLWMRVA